MAAGCEVGAGQVESYTSAASYFFCKEEGKQAFDVFRIDPWPAIGHHYFRSNDVEYDAPIIAIG
jgi:hypothetical protein